MDRETKDIYTKSTGVAELKGKDFKLGKNVTINDKAFKNKPGLIMFYAPWCPHCKDRAEMWSELAIQFQYVFPITAVNVEDKNNYELAKKLNIVAYPTVKYVTPKGNLRDYKHSLDKDELMYFISSKI